MTDPIDIRPTVAAWLRAEAPLHIRGEVLDDTLHLLAVTGQDRRRRLFGRPDARPQRLRWGLVGGLAALAIAGTALGIGAVVRTNEPVTPEPTPPQRSSQEPAPARPSYPLLTGSAVELKPGTYRVGLFPRISLTVPTGWYSAGDWAVWTPGKLPSRAPSIQFRTVENVYVDPCHREAGLLDPAIGSGVDDFVDALTREPGRGAVGPVRLIAVGPYRGAEVVLEAPDDLTACTLRDFRPWVAPGDIESGHNKEVMAPGERDVLWVLSVDGARLVIVSREFPEMTDAQRTELRRIRESIEISR